MTAVRGQKVAPTVVCGAMRAHRSREPQFFAAGYCATKVWCCQDHDLGYDCDLRVEHHPPNTFPQEPQHAKFVLMCSCSQTLFCCPPFLIAFVTPIH